MADAGQNPLLMIDDFWIIDVATHVAILDIASESILVLDPPRSASSVSRPADAVARLMLEANDNLVYGIDNVDESSLGEATTLYLQASDQMQRLTRAVETFCE